MNNKRWDALWINSLIATMQTNGEAYGLIPEGGLAVKDGKIAWIGVMRELPGRPEELADQVFSANRHCITPGLIDCHTHLVYAGNRSHEFEMRLQGATYEEIARQGGGIRSTVKATRDASEEELFLQSIKRARTMLAGGVTTLEIKSGYGLDLETELKILRVAKRIEDALAITVIKTFLGAHTVPLEYQGRADQYIDFVCGEVLPRVAEQQLAEVVDVFCETIGFTYAQTEKVFKTAQQYGLAIKCHAEQLSDSGGAVLASNYQALSVDHLEFLSLQGVQALAKTGTVAVLLPGAFYFLREKQMPPIELLRQHNVPIAIATDCNPGTSPVTSLLLILNMACTLFKLTPEEALAGVTRHAAQALGLQESLGTLSVGKAADFVVWDVQHPAELAYYVGMNSCLQIVKRGEVVATAHCG
ncbi:MAG: imidazolonepropionase [Gammaproteobacteria bacterium]